MNGKSSCRKEKIRRTPTRPARPRSGGEGWGSRESRYQITNNLNDMIYIGSTCLPLRKRWYNHKKDMDKRDMTRPPRRLFQLVEKIGWDEMRIVLARSCGTLC